MKDHKIQKRVHRVFSVEKATSNAKLLMQNIAVSLPRSAVGDADLLRACVDFAETFQKWESLFTETHPFATDAKRDEITLPMIDLQTEQLRMISEIQATTLRGHCARAAVILLFDLGVIIERANAGDAIDQSLFAALLVDLMTSWEVLPSLAGKRASRSITPRKRAPQNK
jgi:predicted nuclease with RNAse H fold